MAKYGWPPPTNAQNGGPILLDRLDLLDVHGNLVISWQVNTTVQPGDTFKLKVEFDYPVFP